MKRLTSLRYWGRMLVLSLPMTLVAGCPVDATLMEAPEDVAGTYWVEYNGALLQAYQLPEVRGDDGQWYDLAAICPKWYTGPALYEVHKDGAWTRLTTDENLTLDEVMQLWDVAPEPGQTADL